MISLDCHRKNQPSWQKPGEGMVALPLPPWTIAKKSLIRLREVKGGI